MPGGRAEVPHPGLAVASEQTPARELVARPFTDDRARDVADVVLVEHEQGAETRGGQGLAHPPQAVAVQTPKVHTLLEVDLGVTGGLERAVPPVTGIGEAGRGWRCRLARHGGLLGGAAGTLPQVVEPAHGGARSRRRARPRANVYFGARRVPIRSRIRRISRPLRTMCRSPAWLQRSVPSRSTTNVERYATFRSSSHTP